MTANRAARDLYRLALAVGFIAIVIFAIMAAPRSPAKYSGDQRDLPPVASLASPVFAPVGAVADPGSLAAAPSLDDGGGISSDLSRDTAVIAYALPSYGRFYLAVPDGRGVRVRICAVGGHPCIIRTSTDAGPSLERQRQGRRADIAFLDFERICGCWPPAVGLLDAVIERDGVWVELPAVEP